MLIEFKKGNKIYIKPKNRGKFTKYCHGKVTDECIRKAKASGNPTLVKRATFADNARHFKHRFGGLIIQKFQEAGKLPTAATYSLWLKGTLSYLTGIKDSDLIESKYVPSKATNKNTKYYTRKGLDYDVMRNLLGGKESKAKEFDGTPLYYKNFNDLYTRLSNLNGKQSRVTDNSHLGKYTIGIGQDKNGRYVSYYDKFDWAPKESLEIFSPYEIYNRIYEKDFNRMLKELDNEEYSGSNPSGKWFFKSGINNKGYLKKGGIVKALEGTKTNFFTKASNWFSNNKDLVSNIGLIGTNLISGLKLNKAIDSQIEANNALMEADKAASWMDNYRKALLQQTDRSDIVNSHNAFLIANSADYSNNKLQKENLKLAQSKTNPTGDFLSSLGGIVSNFFTKKDSTTPASTTSTSITPITFSTPTTDLGNGFSYNLNTGMTYKPNWNSMLKYLFGGKYFLPSIKTKYGYPVYWSDKVPSEFDWANKFLKEHPGVTGFAVGGGAQGDDEDDPRVIIRNVHSNIITDRNDKRWDGLDEIEAIRHFMNETNYHPNFKISPEQETFRRTNFDKNAPYNTNDDAWRQSVISRILLGDMEGTPEQIKEADNFYEKFRKQKGRGYW